MFGVAPDHAARLLGPVWRPTVEAILDARRAARVVEEYRMLAGADEKTTETIAARWRRNGDGAYFKRLCVLAGVTPDELDEGAAGVIDG